MITNVYKILILIFTVFFIALIAEQKQSTAEYIFFDCPAWSAAKYCSLA